MRSTLQLVAVLCVLIGANAWLATDGNQIINATTTSPVHLNSINWYGLESTDFCAGGLQMRNASYIAQTIADLKFNSVRVPMSTELILSNPPIPAFVTTGEPRLAGKHGLDCLDLVVDEITSKGVMVVLDLHMLDGGWCCSGDDENGLWYNTRWSETDWLNSLSQVTARFASNEMVIGVDIKNELRQATLNGTTITPQWGNGNPKTDWAMAAERGGAAVLAANPNALVIVEGLSYAGDLTGVATRPIRLPSGNRLVYESHDYQFSSTWNNTYDDYAANLDKRWGYISEPGHAYTAPLWMGETGTCNSQDEGCIAPNAQGVGKGLWWQVLMRYIGERKDRISWGYWAIDGTQSTGHGRTWNKTEGYGILTRAWDQVALPGLYKDLVQIMS